MSREQWAFCAMWSFALRWSFLRQRNVCFIVFIIPCNVLCSYKLFTLALPASVQRIFRLNVFTWAFYSSPSYHGSIWLWVVVYSVYLVLISILWLFVALHLVKTCLRRQFYCWSWAFLFRFSRWYLYSAHFSKLFFHAYSLGTLFLFALPASLNVLVVDLLRFFSFRNFCGASLVLFLFFCFSLSWTFQSCTTLFSPGFFIYPLFYMPCLLSS